MQINIDYDSSVNNAPVGFKSGVQAAVQYLDRQFTNPITLTVDVGYGEIDGQSLGPGALGESEASQYAAESYSAVRDALLAESALGSLTLPASSPLSGALYSGDTSGSLVVTTKAHIGILNGLLLELPNGA